MDILLSLILGISLGIMMTSFLLWSLGIEDE